MYKCKNQSVAYVLDLTIYLRFDRDSFDLLNVIFLFWLAGLVRMSASLTQHSTMMQ